MRKQCDKIEFSFRDHLHLDDSSSEAPSVAKPAILD